MYNLRVRRYPVTGEIDFVFYSVPIQNTCSIDSFGEFPHTDDDCILSDSDDYENKERSARESRRRTVDKIYNYARSNCFDWFVTITFDPRIVDSFDYVSVSSKLSKWLNNIRQRKCPDMFYLGVPELHKSGRYHFHFLMGNINELDFIDSGVKTKKGETIYNIYNYKYGFTTATKINDNAKVASYIAKYITKELFNATKNKKRYWCSKGLSYAENEKLYIDKIQFDQLMESYNVKISFEKEHTIYRKIYYRTCEFF